MAATIKVQGVLFDFDGVLCNTEPSHRRAYLSQARALAGGRELDLNITGKSNLGLYEDLVARFGGPEPPLALSQRHFQLVYQFLREERTSGMPGLGAVLEGLAARDIPYGVVSSSRRWYVEQNLRDLGMLHRAVCVVTGEDGLPLKPAPDMYLAGAEALGLPKEALLAVEDSFSGLQAALAAGLRCAALHNPDSGRQDLAGASCHLTQLTELLAFLDGDAPEGAPAGS